MSKQRYVEVTDRAEIDALVAGTESLDTPAWVLSHDRWYADADELRQWRAGRTQAQSDPEAT